MSLKGQTLLKGHSLRNEGKAFYDEHDNHLGYGWTSRGKGVCSCGERSPVLDSNSARKRWHRAHKDALR